jgi:HK97 family phage portal protein
MTTLLGKIVSRPADKAPVPYAPRRVPGLPWYTRRTTEGQLRAMGSVGTLFAIVDRLATSTAAPNWRLYREAKPGQDPDERDEVTSHLALDIWRRPNQFFTRALFVETVQQHFELVGEEWWVIARNPRMRSIPLELWPVRPDRMQPVPSPEDYIVGYVYTSPDGEQIPLQLDEVIFVRRPNPYDPYRGIGAVQTILADLEGVRLSAEWNRNFFANSAEPGGLISYDRRLGDTEFNEVRDRWQEQHKGVANAHRVAIIEAGAQWIDRKYSNRDMQFAELRGVSSEVIREAFGIPKFAIGLIDDVNRATAEASRTWFAEQMTVPRLERLKQALNAQFLPLFGATGKAVEFDYESPVPGDREADDRERNSKAKAARDLVEAGWYPTEVLEAVGLPEIAFGQPDADPDRELLIDLVKGAPTLAPLILPMLGFDLGGTEAGAPVAPPAAAAAEAMFRAQAVRLTTEPPRAITAADDGPDLTPVQAALDAALEQLLALWDTGVLPGQYNEIADQITRAVDADEPGQLAALTVATEQAAAVLKGALADMAAAAAQRMADEAAAAGVNVTPPDLDTELADRAPVVVNFGAELVAIAAAVAGLLGTDMTAAAGREAVRLYTPGASGTEVARKVTDFLKGLTGRLRKVQLGAALHRALNLGRLATLAAAMDRLQIVASERMDANTCGPCQHIDGTQMSLAEAMDAYRGGPYWACEGGALCRGTVIGVPREDT